MKAVLGLDFGTNSARALIVDAADGHEIAAHVHPFARGEAGVIVDDHEPELARQHPADYIDALEGSVRGALLKAITDERGFTPADIVGLGVDATGSTPLPLDAAGRALALHAPFEDHPAAMAWLWKDHTAHAEAAELTALARDMRPHYLAKIGGAYSSEWFWAKLLHCLRSAPEVFDAMHTWVELADWLPALLCGIGDPLAIPRGACAAGHKGLFHPDWGGYPDEAFLAALDPALLRVRRTLPERCHTVAERAGALGAEWAERLGLPPGLPVAIGAIDAHLGAVGSGIRPGVLVKILGTSTCDMIVAPLATGLPDIPGICGIAVESILPGHYGLEAGQAAVGDIFNWFVNVIRPGGSADGTHEALAAGAARLRPGESGLLALDWHNGNRNILADQRLTGGVIGLTLRTTPAELQRAWIEATAFGARMIIDRIAEHGVRIDRIVNCGGLAVKSPLLMQIYADVLGRPMEVAGSDQACALGAAVCAAVVAGAHPGFGEAVEAMTHVRERRYEPEPDAARVYDRLFALYRRMHDGFGRPGAVELAGVMKELLGIRDAARG